MPPMYNFMSGYMTERVSINGEVQNAFFIYCFRRQNLTFYFYFIIIDHVTGYHG